MVNKFSFPKNLPITSVKNDLIQLLKNHQVLIVAGETGSGKTTQLPKICLLTECVRKEKMIACTQPRRIAASSVSKRVAEELGADGESLVGYRVRFVDRTKKSTKIKFLTDGLLLAEAAADPRLSRYDVIIVDEAHERSLNIDFLMGLLVKLINKRPELKVIISSATIDTEKFSRFFSDAKVVKIPGKTYPIEVRYAPEDHDFSQTSIVEDAISAVKEVLSTSKNGDILVFMPTERDIVEMVDTINGGANSTFLPIDSFKIEFEAFALFGRMSIKAQGAIFKKSNKRKIVVATNVAETSITVPGIRFVIDSGLARISSYSPKMRSTKLPVQAISVSSADQRKGRCGRVGPGVCVRLYSEENYQNRPQYTLPEIMRSNLADVILRMTNLRLGHPAKFPFIDPPKNKSIKDGINLLQELGALKNIPGKMVLTKRGRIMARLPLDPCLSRIVLEAKNRGVLNPVIIIVSALSIQDPRIRPLGEEKKADEAHKKFIDNNSDFITYLNVWKLFHSVAKKVKSNNKLRKFCRQNYLAYQRMREWMDIYEQICQGVEKKTQFAITSAQENHDAIHKSLLSGLLRNIALKKDKKIFTAAYGKEVMVFPGSGQFEKPPRWILAAELVETSRLYARIVGGIDPAWLEKIAGRLCKHSYSEPHWEKRRGQVVAFEKTTLLGLVINERRKVHFGKIDPSASRQIFIQSALVEAQVNHKLDFLLANNRLIQSLQEIEDRVRARYVIDEYTMYSFYDSRIPEQIVTIPSLLKALPKIESSLYMTESDICIDQFDQCHIEKFPATLSYDTFEFKLYYKFEPGSSEDGVSVFIPYTALPHLNSTLFEWLVPGLLNEKVAALLKSLPKSVRKHLVPVNQTAEAIVESLEFGKGSLFAQISAQIHKRYQLLISNELFQVESLSKHLLMRFCLVNEKGKVLKDTRRFNELFVCELKPSQSANLAKIKKKWQQEDVETYEPNVPQRIEIIENDGEISGYAYPAYVDNENGTVSLEVFSDEQEQLKKHKDGLLVFYNREFSKQINQCKKEFKLTQKDWALFNWLGGLKEVNAQIYFCLLFEIFELKTTHFQTYSEYISRVSTLKKESIIRVAAALFAKIKNTLASRRQAYEVLTKYNVLAEKNNLLKQYFKVFYDELERILPDDFLTTMSIESAQNTCRYLDALSIRTERAYASLGNDVKKAELIKPFIIQLEKLEKKVVSTQIPSQKKILSQLVLEYKTMLEEYRVSVFAPEMKTLNKVSPKRLDQKLGEIGKQL